MAEMLDLETFNARYADWWVPNYWEAVVEMQSIQVFGEEVMVYGTTTYRGGDRWYLCLKPHPERR